MREFHRCCILLLAASLAAPLQAGPIPGRWEKIGSLTPGSRIIVKWKSGDKLEYLYRSLEKDHMLVTDLAGNPLEIPKQQVQKIQRGVPSRDSLVNGTLFGLGLGAGIASFFAIGCPGTDQPAKCFGSLVLTGAGLGAAIGLAADSGVKGHEVLYKAPR